MDAVRAALRIPGIEEVRIVYRRSRDEMPADREEIAAALSEGAILEELALPEAAEAGRLTLRKMRLGAVDASGRRSPEPSDETFAIGCDLLVEALGEACDAALLGRFGVALGPDGRPLADAKTRAALRDTGTRVETRIGAAAIPVYIGGDAARGPASIIAACADGKKAAIDILAGAGLKGAESHYAPPPPSPSKLACRGRLSFPVGEPLTSPEFATREAERCLECDSACLRCVEVCPNRANIAIPVAVDGSFRQSLQILHVDHLCNECGNCGFFCPWEGEPFRGKASLFATKAELERSGNAGFAILIDAAHDGKAAAGDANATPPRLAMRAQAGGEIIVFSRDEWGLAEAGGDQTDRESCAMAALAGAVLRDHPYLIGGRS
jgi:putative selenate reductase